MSASAAASRLAGHRRALLLGGAGLAALALALGATRLLGGGGEDPFADLPDVVAAGTVAAGTAGAGGVPVPQAGAAPVAPAPSAVPAAPKPGEHADGFETATLRDPFCPLVVAAAPGSAPVTCPEQTPAAPGQSMTLLDVFLDAGVPHARARVGPKVYTLHVNDTFDAYKVASLSDRCGEFVRGEERRPLCEGEEWGAAPAPPSAKRP